MGCVVVTAENASCHQYFERRLHLLHAADLPAGGLGAQEKIFRDIEGILLVPCRVILRGIESGEVVVVIFDFRSLVVNKSHAGKQINQLIAHNVDRIERAGGSLDGGHGDVDTLAPVLVRQFFLRDFFL